MTKELYYQQILKLISEGKIVSALDLVEHCAKEFNIDELLVFAILNKARLARAKEEDGIGVLDGTSYNIELNRINKAIIDSINVLKDEPSAFPMGEQVRYGRIAHNIPPTMSRGIAKICKVRIAKLDELLYDKNFPQTAASTPESLEITERMEVELYDPSGGEAFSVEVVNREVKQLVEDHAPTEWKFKVTPLLEGAYPLELRAFLYKKKGNKELSFETQIQVVAYDGEFYAKAAITPWQVKNQVIDLGVNTESKSKKGLFVMLANSALAKAAMLIGVFVLTGLGYLFKNRHNSSVVIPPAILNEYVIKLKVNSKLNVESVVLSNDTISNWTVNQDKNEIYLPAQKAGSYNIVIKGSNGTCSRKITLSSDSSFTLDCKIIEPKKPNSEPIDPKVGKLTTPKPVEQYEVEIITPFTYPTIKIDGNVKKITSFEVLKIDKNINRSQTFERFKTVFNLKKGNHQLIIEDLQRLYSCSDSIKNVNITNATQVVFDCTKKRVATEKEKSKNKTPVETEKQIIPIERFSVIYKIKDVYDAPISSIQIYMDGKKVEVIGSIKTVLLSEFKTAKRRTAKEFTIKISNISKGEHTFEASVQCSRINGTKVKKVIDKNDIEVIDASSGFSCVN
jgi:hypothetical protein